MSSIKRKKPVRRPSKVSRRLQSTNDVLNRLAEAHQIRDASLASLVYAVSHLPGIDQKKPVIDAGTVLFSVLTEQCIEWLARNRGGK